MLTNEDARGDILGYYILYKRKSEPEASWKNKTVDRAETTSSVLASLDEYTSYQFAIQAFNRKGVSGRSEIVERETDEGGKLLRFEFFSFKFVTCFAVLFCCVLFKHKKNQKQQKRDSLFKIT